MKNNRLNALGFVWTFSTIVRTGPTREHYDHRWAHGDRHAAALRHLFNRMLGQLYYCLQTGQNYDPSNAFGEQLAPSEDVAA
ncbi:hypothetical protein MOQ72_36615 [Saccharopolyspora sp. K220]|uniref:hypothetical protein n=1 Tax=Saccharopolyspora soli TaxID=2926618 RepID=UPI001F597FBB|nr:hypothetical protein [Saccharopolyspora soli]MCI2422956.1 hypothetical protein [Saccharopolyspora soli]